MLASLAPEYSSLLRRADKVGCMQQSTKRNVMESFCSQSMIKQTLKSALSDTFEHVLS